MLTHKPTPSRALDGGSSSVKLLLHIIDGSKGRFDRFLKVPVFQNTSDTFAIGRGRSKVLPEKRMVDMS